MLKLAFGLIITGAILIISFVAFIGPLNQTINTLTDTANKTIDGDYLIDCNTHLNNIPTIFGMIGVLLLVSGMVAFAFNSLAEEPERFEYRR